MANKNLIPKEYLLPFVLVTSMFFMWGLASNMTDTLLAAFKRIMSMTDFQTSWIQVAFYGSYFCLALPAAILIRKYQYKTGLLVGLGMFIAGSLLFYPASKTMVYGHFLVSLFILAGGLSILETTANPYLLVMGDKISATRRLNMGQSFNPIGSMTGILLSKFFILESLHEANETERASFSVEALESIQVQELNAVMGPYVGVAVLLLFIWLIIALQKMPKATDNEKVPPLKESIRRLLGNKNYVMGVVTQFFYVGAQVGVWSYTIRYAMQELNVTESEASSFYLAAIILFTLSRFLFTALMSKYSEAKLMGSSAVLAVIFLLIVIFSQGIVGVLALILVSGCMSLMFPTIFGLASEGTGNDHKLASSGLIMAIFGGAALTPVQGQISDLTGSVNYSFFVPIVCFVVVAVYSFNSKFHQR